MPPDFRMLFSKQTALMSATVAGVLAATALAGCRENGETAAIERPAVDPRFATAEALVDYYNELTTDRHVVDTDSTLELLFAENDQQRRIIAVLRNYAPILKLEQAMWERFGERLDAKEKLAPQGPNLRPAIITEHAGQRAMARETNRDGAESNLYLVQIGDRWWISGYTLENDLEFKSIRDDLEGFEQITLNLAGIAPGITQRLRGGEFTAPDDVRKAMGEALVAQLEPPAGQQAPDNAH
ncbi:MAG: hypothetical protein ACYSTY_09235 [Planctomycetota bacterium]|jgi:hypothetical protein